jgi:hypothetical protein
MTAPMVLDGPMNSTAFFAYVEQVLARCGVTGFGQHSGRRI